MRTGSLYRRAAAFPADVERQYNDANEALVRARVRVGNAGPVRCSVPC